MTLTTEAVVLRGIRYSESSKILTLYTRARGKLSAMAKGALRPGSKFGASLEPMSYVTAVLYVKETRDIQLLAQCDVMKPFRGLTDNLERMAAGMAIVELLDAVTHAEEHNDILFQLLVQTLEAVSGATKGPEIALYFFEVRLLEVLGFRPDFRNCVTCHMPVDAVAMGAQGGESRLSQSGVVCPRCAGNHRGLLPVSPGALRVLQRMQELQTPEGVTRWALSPPVGAEVGGTLRRFLVSHIEGLRTSKSQEVFASMFHQ